MDIIRKELCETHIEKIYKIVDINRVLMCRRNVKIQFHTLFPFESTRNRLRDIFVELGYKIIYPSDTLYRIDIALDERSKKLCYDLRLFHALETQPPKMDMVIKNVLVAYPGTNLYIGMAKHYRILEIQGCTTDNPAYSYVQVLSSVLNLPHFEHPLYTIIQQRKESIRSILKHIHHRTLFLSRIGAKSEIMFRASQIRKIIRHRKIGKFFLSISIGHIIPIDCIRHIQRYI